MTPKHPRVEPRPFNTEIHRLAFRCFSSCAIHGQLIDHRHARGLQQVLHGGEGEEGGLLVHFSIFVMLVGHIVLPRRACDIRDCGSGCTWSYLVPMANSCRIPSS